MNGITAQSTSPPPKYSVVEPAPHSLYECSSGEEFGRRFEALTGLAVRNVADTLIAPTAPRAIFLVGSLPLGMATAGSDIDFVALVDSQSALHAREDGGIANNDQSFAFSNESNALIVGTIVTMLSGLAVEVQAAVVPTISRVQRRLRTRGPWLSESEVQTLGRLSTGWLLWETEGYLERSGVALQDSALEVWCATRQFVAALIHRRKAIKVLEFGDVPLTLHLLRSSVEAAYLAYFASQGLCYLGVKWLAMLGHAREAAARLRRHPLLEEGIALLFPLHDVGVTGASQYLQRVSAFITSMRKLIEEKTLFRIAFHACPQIHPIP